LRHDITSRRRRSLRSAVARRHARRICFGMPMARTATYNSMFKATTTTANGHTVEALPIDRTVALLKAHKIIR
jgi:hypothetical protein